MVVEVKGITKYFGETKALDDVNLRFEDGEIFVLLGPSGCGKTTLLRVIAGLLEPDRGEVVVNGKVVNGVPPADRNVAMVFQNYALYPHMTVYENIALNMKVRGVRREVIDEKVRRVAKVLKIEQLLFKRPGQLSGGQAQRVALARAMVRDPSVYLMDEPLSNLDAKLRVEARAEIKRMKEMVNVPIVYVTHDQVEAMSLGDKVAVMNEGRVLQVGTPLELYDRPRNVFVATFVGNPPMNVIPPDRLQFLRGVEIPPSMGKYRVGVRPSRLRPGEGQVSLKARVEFVEPLGDQTLIHCRVGDLPLVATAEASWTAKEGSEVVLGTTVDALYWFDEEGNAKYVTEGLNTA